MQERAGDFRDWRDAHGNLIPIYDPATLRSDGNGGFIKDQFMGCDGKHAQRDLFESHQPDRAAVAGGAADAHERRSAQQLPGAADSGHHPWLTPTTTCGRIDTQFGTNHVFASFWHQRAPAKFYSQLPQPIATETYSDPQNSWVNRMNYDKILSNNLVNHAAMGYLNRNEGYGCVNQDFVDQFPQIGGRGGSQRAAADRHGRRSTRWAVTRASTSGTSRRGRPSSPTMP